MRTTSLAVILFLLIASISYAEFRLTLLHNNDGESQLVNLGAGLENYGGVAHFKSKADSLKSWADSHTDGWIMLTSGDNFLAGPEWNASIENGVYYDAIAIDRMGYHALCIGNHDFDSGPNILAEFIDATGNINNPWFLSCNLDFTGEPALQTLVGSKLAESSVFDINGTQVAVIGATTPNVGFVSVTGNIGIIEDVVGEISKEVTEVTKTGAKIIILVCHLQGIEEDLALISSLKGVDIVIAGGGDELLATFPDDQVIPGDESERYGDYPMYAEDATGQQVPVVTTRGNFGYLGMLVTEFDNEGNLLTVDDLNSGPRVVGNETIEGGVPANPEMVEAVVKPVLGYVDALESHIIATSEVKLDGIRNHVRGREANEGNLIADALLWSAIQLHEDFDAPRPEIALQNGGGIRNDSYVPAGGISELNTFNMLPFGNKLTIVHDLSPAELKAVMENSVSADFGGSGTGRYAQIAGFRFEFDINYQAQAYANNYDIVTPGERVRNAWLDDGTVLVKDGIINGDAPHVDLVTGDFLANGGDQYPLRHKQRTILGRSDQQALASYLVHIGKITEADYPLAGEGRTVALHNE
jgi:5'-nucleotidase / UDP-sugar diphosphatase